MRFPREADQLVAGELSTRAVRSRPARTPLPTAPEPRLAGHLTAWIYAARRPLVLKRRRKSQRRKKYGNVRSRHQRLTPRMGRLPDQQHPAGAAIPAQQPPPTGGLNIACPPNFGPAAGSSPARLPPWGALTAHFPADPGCLSSDDYQQRHRFDAISVDGPIW